MPDLDWDSNLDSDSKPNGYIATLHGVRFRFQSWLPTALMGSESESVHEFVSHNVNAPLQKMYYIILSNVLQTLE